MKRVLIICGACIVLAGGAGLPAQTRAEADRLMETARRAAVIERDLRGAIDQYRRIAERFKDEPSIAVPALLQMAEHQQTLGDTQARQTLERIIAAYPRAAESVALARARLAALGSVGVATLRRDRELIAGDPGGTLQFNAGASMSRDGRSLAVIDWFQSGDIAIQDTVSGSIRRLMIKKGTYLGDTTGEGGGWTMLSPDGTKVVFLWTPGDIRNQVRVADVQGTGESRLLIQTDEKEIRWADPGAWSPDGRSVYLVLDRPDGAYVARVAIADGAVQLVRPLGRRVVRGGGAGGLGGGSRPALSPDGRWIAYAALASDPSEQPRRGAAVIPTPPLQRTGIYVTAADGSGAETLVADGDDATNQFPAWADSSHLLFLSNRPVNNESGEQRLWWVGVREGKPIGAPSPGWLQAGRIFPLGMTDSGSFYYIRERSGDDVFTLRMTSSGSLDRSAAARLTARAPDSNFGPVWSPDGQHVAFKRRARPGRCGPLESPCGIQLVVRSQRTGEERVYIEGFAELAPIIWSHDGRSILTGAPAARGGRPPVQFRRLDLESGGSATIETPLRVGTFIEGRGLGGALSTDDRTLYARDWKEDGTAAIVALDLGTAAIRTIWSMRVSDSRLVSAPALNPDGNTLAFVLLEESGRGRLVRVGVDGSGFREVAAGLASPAAPQWADGGRTLLFVESDGGRRRLMRVAASGGLPVFTGFAAPDEISYHLSPDGTQLAFSERFSNQLWALDNLRTLWTPAR